MLKVLRQLKSKYMKLKHILCMIAGLVTLTATSCKDNATVSESTDAIADATAEVLKDTPAAELSAPAEIAHPAYYVTFLGDGG